MMYNGKDVDVENENGWLTVLSWLPAGWKEAMRTTKCFERPRNIKREEDYLRILLAYPALKYSLKALSRWAAKKGIAKIKAESIWERMQVAVPFFYWLVGELVKPFIKWGNFNFILAPIDGTTFSLPASEKRDWIVHMLWQGGHPVNMRISKGTGKGSGESLKNLQEMPENTIVLADRAYGTPPQLADAQKKKRSYIIRFTWNNLPLYKDEKKNPLDPFKLLSKMEIGEIREFYAWVHPEGETPFETRVVVVRKDEKSAEKARRRCKKESTRKGHIPRKLTLFLAAFVTIVTDLNEKEYPKEIIADAYRWRYQIEREFRRFKSTTQIRKLINKKDSSSQVYILAAFVSWLIAHRMAHESVFFPWGYPLVQTHRERYA